MSDSASWTERYAAAPQVWGSEPNQFVVEVCEPLRPGRALDLGAGEGRNALWLAAQGWMVTAVDFVDIAVTRIAGRAAMEGLRVESHAEDVLAFHPVPDHYDLVLLSYLQLPLPQLRKALANSAPGLAPNGIVVVIAHDSSNLHLGYGGPRDPDLLTTPEKVSRILADLGLQIERAEVVEREIPVDIGFRYARDHIVIARRPAAFPG